MSEVRAIRVPDFMTPFMELPDPDARTVYVSAEDVVAALDAGRAVWLRAEASRALAGEGVADVWGGGRGRRR